MLNDDPQSTREQVLAAIQKVVETIRDVKSFVANDEKSESEFTNKLKAAIGAVDDSQNLVDSFGLSDDVRFCLGDDIYLDEIRFDDFSEAVKELYGELKEKLALLSSSFGFITHR